VLQPGLRHPSAPLVRTFFIFIHALSPCYFYPPLTAGISAQAIHATEWLHGDLGTVRPGDVVLVLSHSGATAEACSAAAAVSAAGATAIAVTGKQSSALGNACTLSLVYNGADVKGASLALYALMAEPLGLVPTASVVAQEALCNALLATIVARRGMTRQQFVQYHPGGSIGAAR
jgi:arabinose-5-phosphate isomerase